MSMSQWEQEYHTNLIRVAENSIVCVEDMIQVLLCDDSFSENNIDFTRKMFVHRLNMMRETFIERVPALIHPLHLKEKAA